MKIETIYPELEEMNEEEASEFLADKFMDLFRTKSRHMYLVSTKKAEYVLSFFGFFVASIFVAGMVFGVFNVKAFAIGMFASNVVMMIGVFRLLTKT